MRAFEYAVVTLIGLGLACAVAAEAGRAIAQSLNQSAQLVSGARQ